MGECMKEKGGEAEWDKSKISVFSRPYTTTGLQSVGTPRIPPWLLLDIFVFLVF